MSRSSQLVLKKSVGDATQKESRDRYNRMTKKKSGEGGYDIENDVRLQWENHSGRSDLIRGGVGNFVAEPPNF